MSDEDSIVPTELDSPTSDCDELMQLLLEGAGAASSNVAEGEHIANTVQGPSMVPPTTSEDKFVNDTDPHGFLQKKVAPTILDGNIVGDADMYGFLQREEEKRSRPSRSRTPTRNELIAARPKLVLGSTGDAPAAGDSGSTSTYVESMFATLGKQTVCLQVLPRSMQDHADRQVSFVPQLIYSSMDTMGKVAYHLRDKFPGREWQTYLNQVGEFGKFCNTVDDLRKHEDHCNCSFKYGATACLVRRWWTLGLYKSYSHLFYYITSSLEDSKSLETALIGSAKASNDPIRRLRCENNTVGGEGLGQDPHGNYTVSGHFVYLAVAKKR